MTIDDNFHIVYLQILRIMLFMVNFNQHFYINQSVMTGRNWLN